MTRKPTSIKAPPRRSLAAIYPRPRDPHLSKPTTMAPEKPSVMTIHVTQNCHESLPGGGQIRWLGANTLYDVPSTANELSPTTKRKMVSTNESHSLRGIPINMGTRLLYSMYLSPNSDTISSSSFLASL